MSKEDLGAPTRPLAGSVQNLLALADRCEREKADWVLDMSIGEAVCGVVYGSAGALRFTTSLDAAVTLVPDMQWGVNWDIEGVHARGFPDNVAICVYVWLNHPTCQDTFVRSPGSSTYAEAVKWLPRLICAAALRARAESGKAAGPEASARESEANGARPSPSPSEHPSPQGREALKQLDWMHRRYINLRAMWRPEDTQGLAHILDCIGALEVARAALSSALPYGGGDEKN